MPQLKHEPAYDLNMVITVLKKIDAAAKCMELDCSCPLKGENQVFAHVENSKKARQYYAKLIGVHTGLFLHPSAKLSPDQWGAICDLRRNLKALYPHLFESLPCVFIAPQMRALKVGY